MTDIENVGTVGNVGHVENIKQQFSDPQIAGIAAGVAVGAVAIGFIFLKARRLLLAFMIGSSLPATIFSLSYIGIANLNFKGIENFEYMAIYVPLFYGAFNVLTTGFSKYFSKIKYLPIIIPFLVGGTHGLVFSVFGRYLMGNLPVKNFNFKESEAYLVHIYSFMYYAAVYGIVISFVNKLYFLY